MLSWGNMNAQCGDYVQHQNMYATSHHLTDSHHVHGSNYHHHNNSHDLDHIELSLDHTNYSLTHINHSQDISVAQNKENDAMSPTGYDVMSPTGSAEWDDLVGMSLTRQQIHEHNQKVGWEQWITLKGNVYHTTGFRDHFITYNRKKAAEKTLEETRTPDCDLTETVKHHEQTSENMGHSVDSRMADTVGDVFQKEDLVKLRERYSTVNNDSDDDSTADNDSDDGLVEEEKVDSTSENGLSDEEFLWKYDVIGALRKSGLSLAEIESEIRPFKIGTLQNMALPRWKYWNSIRTDILALHEDITKKDTTDIGVYEGEYLALLQRWLRKYRDLDPVEKHPSGDGNVSVFFLTEDPDSLRDWIKTLPPLDTELPDSGAWVSSELLLSPLGDTHDVFTAALREHHANMDPFSHEIKGKVAWTELPHDVIKNDLMTPSQQLVHEARLMRGDRVHDPTLMKKRRERLGRYFMKKYHYSKEHMGVFLQWAAVMEKSQRDLGDLCSGRV